jgi:hypothetical protein
MRARLAVRSALPSLVSLALLAEMLACSQGSPAPAEQPRDAEPTPATVTAAPKTAPTLHSSEIHGPQGLTLTLDGQALTDNAEVRLDVLLDGGPSTEGTPFEKVGPAFRVDFGEGDQIRGMVLTIPLSVLPGFDIRGDRLVHAAWAQPDAGLPSMVGVLVDQNRAAISVPIVGAGEYQVLGILLPVGVEPAVWKPLAVPTYKQMGCRWCSTTALTDVAGYHEGEWPAGGYGSTWGESSNWYLAGLAGQPCDEGIFFHYLLNAGGYTTPVSFRQSFTNGNAEVIIWNWELRKLGAWDIGSLAGSDSFLAEAAEEALNSSLEYAMSLFQFFRAYVETNVWGLDGDRRPVAWGSALAGHSRAITGSDSKNMFYNDPSSGSLNDSVPWEVYQQEVLESMLPSPDTAEVIDTVVFHADPRPPSERRGVLWLDQWSASWVGSIMLPRGTLNSEAVYWRWDGAGEHDYGYYFQAPPDKLPPDATFEVLFKAMAPVDKLAYNFAVRSISDAGYDFVVRTQLFSEAGEVETLPLPDRNASVPAGGRTEVVWAGDFPIGVLPPGLYHLKFTLMQGGVTQDVKYVFFRLAERGYTPSISTADLKQNAFCRAGPGTAFGVETGFEPPTELTILGVNEEHTWGKVEAIVGGNRVRCWISLDLMQTDPAADFPVIPAPPLEIEPAASPCAQYTTPQTCAQHGDRCTWNRLVSPAACQAK